MKYRFGYGLKVIKTCTILGALVLGLSACLQSQEPTDSPAGWACSTPKKGSNVTAGYFRGWEQTPYQYRGSGLIPVTKYRCFSTPAQCENWLYRMTQRYNDKTLDAAICRQF